MPDSEQHPAGRAEPQRPAGDPAGRVLPRILVPDRLPFPGSRAWISFHRRVRVTSLESLQPPNEVLLEFGADGVAVLARVRTLNVAEDRLNLEYESMRRVRLIARQGNRGRYEPSDPPAHARFELGQGLSTLLRLALEELDGSAVSEIGHDNCLEVLDRLAAANAGRWGEADRRSLLAELDGSHRLVLAEKILLADAARRAGLAARGLRSARDLPGSTEDRVRRLCLRIEGSGLAPFDVEAALTVVEDRAGRDLRSEFLLAAESLRWEPPGLRQIDSFSAEQALRRARVGDDALLERLLPVLHLIARYSILGREPEKPNLLLFGPPGTGKTSIAKALASALGRPFESISLAGAEGHSLRGADPGYRNAGPGLLIGCFRRAPDPLILLDEIDKVDRGAGSNAEQVLLGFTDQSVAAYRDAYLNLPFRCDRALVVATANDLDRISAPLRDRFRLIEVPPYTKQQRLRVALEALAPALIAGLPLFPNESIELGKEALAMLVERTPEAGVRQLTEAIRVLATRALGELEFGRRLESYRLHEGHRHLQIGPEDVTRWLDQRI